MSNMDEKLKAIYNFFGFENQLDKLAEEATELLMAIVRFKSGKGTLDDVLAESQDVQVIKDQLFLQAHLPIDRAKEVYEYKVNRTIKRYNIKVGEQ